MAKRIKQNKSQVLIASVVINFILGSIYAWSEYKVLLMKQFGWERDLTKHPFTLMIIFFVIATLIGGRIQNKYKPRIVCIIGSLLFGLGFILTGINQDYHFILISYGIIVGTGMGLCFSTTIPTTMKWFDYKKTGIVIGLIVSGLGLAPLYMDLVTKGLIAFFDFKQSLFVLGLVSMFLVWTLSIFIVNPTEKIKEADSKKTGSILKSRYFYNLWSIMFLSTFASLLVIGCLGRVAYSQIPWKAGFYLVVIISIASFFGRILGGYIFDRLKFKKTFILIVSIQLINIILFWSYKSISLFIIGSSVSAFIYGTFFTLMPSILIKQFGRLNFGLNYGFLLTGWGTAVILNSIIIKKLVVHVGTLNIPHILAILFLGICLYMTKNIRTQTEV